MMRALFYRGWHHFRTAPRLSNGQLLTVWELAARLRRESVGTASFVIEPDLGSFDFTLHRALLGMFEHPEHFAPEQLGAMSV